MKKLTIADVISPKTEKALPQEVPHLPFLGLDDVEAHTMKLLGVKEAGEMKSSAKVFSKGDVLYSRLRPYLNKVWRADRDGLCSAEFIVLPENDFINSEFLKYRLNARDFVSFANSLNAGDRPRVDFEQISSFTLPPFSLAHQRRIVAKIEELFSELDAGIASLKQARTQLGTYRQSLLKQAFEGKLTAQWRHDHTDQLESPEKLLTRIQEERESRYQTNLQTWQTSVEEWESKGKEGKKPAKPRVPKLTKNFDDDELQKLASLPDTWSWIHPDQLVANEPYALGIGPFGSNLKVSDYTDEGVPLVFVKNITRKNFTLEPRFVSVKKAKELHAHSTQSNDLLITKMGDPPGDCTIYPSSAPYAIITADCLKFRVNPNFCHRLFYCHFINSIICRKQLGLITRGVAQKKISVERFKSIGVPLCSLPEQQEIVRLLEEQFTAIEQNEREIDASLQRAEALRQSILKRAFSGQLVPQDPTDEPASQLLARIQAERNKRAAQTPKMPKKKAAKKKSKTA